jgi:hypothetical protein
MANKRTLIGTGGARSKLTQTYAPKKEPVAKAQSVEAVAQQGAALRFPHKPLESGPGYTSKPMPPTGVPGHYNSKTSGPGSLRTVMKSGRQSHYGSNPPNAVNTAPDPSSTGTRGRDILSDYGPERK